MIQCQRENSPIATLGTFDEVLDFFELAKSDDVLTQQKANFYSLLAFSFENGFQERLTHLGLFAHHYTMAWQAKGYNPMDYLTVMIMHNEMIVSNTGSPTFMHKHNIDEVERVVEYTEVEKIIREYCV